MWRGDLSPLGCEAAPPNRQHRSVRSIQAIFIGAASQPNGDKSPRHKRCFSGHSPLNPLPLQPSYRQARLRPKALPATTRDGLRLFIKQGNLHEPTNTRGDQ
ncbi:hypothetical protein C0J56_20205 [Pseudomonas fluorescens]|nr:hypothetical protein C0J56_20205 [Pseudomonas fluorescens]